MSSNEITPEADGRPSSIATQDVSLSRRERLRATLLIGLLSFVVYNANFRSISAGDTYPARYLPFAIVKHQTILLDPIERVASQGRGDGAFWMVRLPDGHIISLYPIVLPVVISPLYVPAVAYLNFTGWTDARFDRVARVMEKFSASLLAAISVSLLFLLLLRRTNLRDARILTLAYAFGTTTWVVSSQALWQHGLAELLVIGTLLLLTDRCSWPRVCGAGLMIGLLAANRPPDVILGAVLGLYGLYWAGRRRGLLLSAAALLPMIIVLLYNLHFAGNIAGGYGLIGTSAFFDHDLLQGMAGLLVSPTRGLLVYSPFLIFLVFAWRYVPRIREERLLVLAMAVGVALQFFIYAKVDWRSGLSWGPRYMTDLLPFLMWLLAPVVASLRRWARAAFLFTVSLSVAIQAVGAYAYHWSVDVPLYANDPDIRTHDMRAAWQISNASFLRSLARGRAPAELLVAVRGNIDGVHTSAGLTNEIKAGQEAFATGWALDGDRPPWQIAINIDGRLAGASNTFTERLDVREALQVASPSGWRVPLDTTSIAPGVHRLTATVWASPDGEPHYLDDHEITVRATVEEGSSATATTRAGESDLAADFTKAAATIRQHQDAQGYWTTSFTSDIRFSEPRPEMNTFLTALLIDVLEPVGTRSGLSEALHRAKRHLTSQIEPSGLVRYHGLPDAPGIGTLGCAITPDTDNTALAWRLAPAADRGRLTSALSTIEDYRTGDGLYRTWLAPRAAYQCLDPGRDPNPADLAIQMHLLLLLSDVQPVAGRALCDAVRRVVDDDRVWVYYRNAPLIPILRLPDVREAGCDVTLPESRMRTIVPDQQVWVTTARMLAGEMPPDAMLTRALLRELARDDFAIMRTNPPLMYHNDLTATVSRYYWSADLGYALWLRLYDHYDHLRNRSRQ